MEGLKQELDELEKALDAWEGSRDLIEGVRADVRDAARRVLAAHEQSS